MDSETSRTSEWASNQLEEAQLQLFYGIQDHIVAASLHVHGKQCNQYLYWQIIQHSTKLYASACKKE